MSRRASHRSIRRRGSLATEALLIVPLLMVISIAMLEFGILLSVQQAVAQAAIEGAREAGKGAPIDDVEMVVNQSLAGHNISIGPDASVVLEDAEMGVMDQRGTLACDPPATPAVNHGNVRVTVCVASTATPIVGQLPDFGFADLVGKILTKSAVVKRECP